MHPIHDDSAFLKTLTLLHVEDDPDTRAQLGRFLSNRVGTLVTAANGREGLAAFHAHHPDIVITDIQMPEMDGLALAQAIKSIEQSRDTAVPVIVTTAFEQTDYLMRAIEIGIDKYIVKPIDPARLQQAMLECAYKLRIVAEKTELEAQNRQLQKAESLGRMAGAIAHHFNNQLQTVMGNLELALSEMLEGDADTITDCLNEAMGATHRASEVSGLMLTYLGQIPTKRSPQDLSRICRKNLPLFIAAMPKEVHLKTDLSLTGPTVHANENQIRQVLTNLIGNAREAMGAGEKTIHLSVRETAAADIPTLFRFPAGWVPKTPAYACIEVSDTGCGIPHPDIEKIFDPFFTTRFTGRGMGLPVTLGIVHATGGVITVESEPGQGSVFRVFLPLSTDASR
jgi:signal transduction histidine kinase